MINKLGVISPFQGQDYQHNFNVRDPNNVNFSFGRKLKTESFKPIGLNEGLKLICKGAVKQVKDTISAIVEHPVKTLVAVGGTTAVLFALPLIGIPTAVGGSALALGFAGLATGKALYHSAQFIKNNEEGSYDIARQNLENIGGDGVDLALSAPFVPKALSEINKFTKYGKIGLNTEALNALTSAKGLKAKVSVLKDANKEVSRAINFQESRDIEMAKLTDLQDAPRADMEKYINKYNVSNNKIADVTLDMCAEEKGVYTKPKLKWQSLKKTTTGYATPNECSITLNDYGDNIVNVSGNCNTQRYQQIGRAKLKTNNKLEFIYKDNQTGQIFTESIDQSLVQEII